MNYAQSISVEPAGSIVEELRAEGVPYADIRLALDVQAAQRNARAPVLSLRQICGLEQVDRGASRNPFTNTRALIGMPRGGRPTGGLHITRRKIWANSVKTESAEEAEFVTPISDSVRKRIFVANDLTFNLARKIASEARAGDRVLTEQEEALTQFTQACHRVLNAMLRRAKGRKGWLTPDYEAIMSWTGLSRSTVARSLNTLKALGLVDWIRRFIYVHDTTQGARSKQTSNLYRLGLPEWLAKRIGLHAPLPDDEQARRDAALEDHAAMLASSSDRERRRLMPEDPVSCAALVNAALRLDSRECQKNIAPLRNIYSLREMKRNRPSRPIGPALTG
jgi:hypothetical protein